ncbi:MAG: hypothetical protein AAFN93_00945, partial [Bacteroidota bacterium]
NYFQRLQYGRFLHQSGKKEEALNKLTELLDEFDQMASQEKRFHGDIRQAIQGYFGELKRERD